ncbi:hypothetical protein ACFVJH_23090 [Streptomyces decoyicus]|uniref:hypothetical protein n=1 Tax=Streptomyces decoyicus TaxID=249567 RepID=UPI003642345C
MAQRFTWPLVDLLRSGLQQLVAAGAAAEHSPTRHPGQATGFHVPDRVDEERVMLT